MLASPPVNPQRWRVLALGLSICVAGCAHRDRGSLETLKPVTQDLLLRLGWRDPGAAARLIVPERRTAFLKSYAALRSDPEGPGEMMFFESEVVDVRLAPDQQHAEVITELRWGFNRLSKAFDATVVNLFVFRDGEWLLAYQDGGPFKELQAPYVDPPKPAEPGAKPTSAP